MPTSTTPSPPAIRVASRTLAAASAFAIPALTVGGDLVARGRRMPLALASTYAAGALLSFAVWGLGMEAARHPRRGVRLAARVFLGVTAAFGLGLQAVVLGFTHAYLGRRALLLALGIPNLLKSSYVAHDAVRIALACAVPAAAVVGVAVARARALGPVARRPALAAVAFVGAVLATTFAPFAAQGFQALPPDVLWMHGTGGLVLHAMGRARAPKVLPPGAHDALPPAPPAARDAPPIVLILGESLRRDAMCAAPAEGCAPTPRLDEAAPHRIAFARAFSTATCTELASAALWTGRAVDTPPESMARAPLVWDWAKARGYRTAYLTSQNLLFQQSDLFLRGSRIDLLREARDYAIDTPIDDGAPDESLTAPALAFLEADGAPAFLVIHHANTHAPYRQPDGVRGPDDGLARYKGSLVRNDALLGDLVRRIRGGPRGRRAIIVYASDHGEAFNEHGASYHSFDLYAEQLDIPLWMDAPADAIDAATRARLAAEAPSRPVALLDVTATLVDLMGGLDVPAFRAQAAALAGTSLLREAPEGRKVLLWNCPPMRECATEAFGVVAFPMKLHWVGHDARYACHDLAADPHELAPLPAGRCAALFPVVDAAFGARPRPPLGLAPEGSGG